MSLECSVIIPTYNATETLGEQLAALSQQKGDVSFEVIVADNGSTDDFQRVVGLWASSIDVRVVDASARRGPSAARNIGAESARADHLLFCDADDIVSDRWARALLDGLAANDFVGGPYVAFAAKAGIWLPSYETGRLPRAWLERPYAFGGNFGVTRSMWDELGGFDESLTGAEEIEFAWRAHDAGFTPTFVAESVVQYRVRRSVRGRLWHEYNSGRGTVMLAAKVMPTAVVTRSWRSQVRHNLMLASRFPKRLDGADWAAWAATLAFEWGTRAGRRESSG